MLIITLEIFFTSLYSQFNFSSIIFYSNIYYIFIFIIFPSKQKHEILKQRNINKDEGGATNIIIQTNYELFMIFFFSNRVINSNAKRLRSNLIIYMVNMAKYNQLQFLLIFMYAKCYDLLQISYC